MKRKSNCTFWVSMRTFRWAQVRWKGRDVRINTYISDSTLLVTKPNYVKRYFKICPVIAKVEADKWQKIFEMPTALRKALKK